MNAGRECHCKESTNAAELSLTKGILALSLQVLSLDNCISMHFSKAYIRSLVYL